MKTTPSAMPLPMSLDAADEVLVSHRLHGSVSITNAEIAKLMVITLADYLEQVVEVNGWRDHHQVDAPLTLYPGDGKPGLALHWVSQMCRAVRGHLEVIPPIFDECTAVISYEAELSARDQYWHVVLHESSLSDDEQLALLDAAATLNPFVAEPHLLSAQLHLRHGRFGLAAAACIRALDRFYTMATAWDKRRSFGAWVGFARLLYLRSVRMADGLTSMPISENLPPTAGGLKLVSLDSLVAEMP